MECEIIELDNDVIYSKSEHKGRCILLIAKVTDANKDKYWLHCHKCHIISGLGLHTVEIKEGKVTLNPSVLCPRDSCKEHYFIKDGKVC